MYCIEYVVRILDDSWFREIGVRVDLGMCAC